MRSITNLFAAFANLAGSINAVAGVIDGATGRLRQSIALDTDPPALGHGEVIDGHAEADSSSNGTAKRGKRQSAV